LAELSEQTYLISGDVAQRVIDYLASRPFKEVFQILPPMLELTEVTGGTPILPVEADPE
jgi:hypothetical protein